MDRTKIVPNHNEGEYDVRWSFLIRLSVWFMGIIATVAAAALVSMAALGFATVQKLNIMDERQQMVISNQKEMRADIQNLKDQVSAEDYVSKTEFQAWMLSHEREKAIKSIMAGESGREIKR